MNDNFDPQSDAIHDPATNEDAEYHAVTRRTFLRGTTAVILASSIWDTPHVFVTGAALDPQNPCFNPTGTLAPLTYMTGDTIRGKYFKQPNKLLT